MSKTHYRYCLLLRYVHTHTRTHVLHDHTAMVSYKYSHTRTHTSFCNRMSAGSSPARVLCLCVFLRLVC